MSGIVLSVLLMLTNLVLTTPLRKGKTAMIFSILQMKHHQRRWASEELRNLPKATWPAIWGARDQKLAASGVSLPYIVPLSLYRNSLAKFPTSGMSRPSFMTRAGRHLMWVQDLIYLRGIHLRVCEPTPAFLQMHNYIIIPNIFYHGTRVIIKF